MTGQRKASALSLAVASQIREARIARGWDQKKLAERAGVSHATVSAVEAGHRSMTFKMAEKLAGALGARARVILDTEPCGTCGGKPPAPFICPDCGRAS